MSVLRVVVSPPGMTGSPGAFGELLRRHRQAIGLTQLALAERAGLSVHGIQKLERGATHPYRDTAQRLIAALELEPDDAARLRAAVAPVRRHVPGGPPGAGLQETLRHESAHVAIERSGDEVWLAELGPVTDPEKVAPRVAAVLGVRESAEQPLLPSLIRALRTRSVRLVLDNCEHVLDACARLLDGVLRLSQRARPGQQPGADRRGR